MKLAGGPSERDKSHVYCIATLCIFEARVGLFSSSATGCLFGCLGGVAVGKREEKRGCGLIRF